MQNIQNKNGYDLKLLDISENCYAHLVIDRECKINCVNLKK